MVQKEEPMWRVMVSFFLIAAANLATLVLVVGSMLGVPYLLVNNWGAISGYVCGTSCGRVGDAMLKVYAIVMWSLSTSIALMAGPMLGFVFKERLAYLERRIPPFIQGKLDDLDRWLNS